MNKYIVLLLICTGLVSGAVSQVMVLKLHYENEVVTLVNSSIAYGFSPDRRYQPTEGYRLEMLDPEGVIHSFMFKAPNYVYREGNNDEGNLEGGLIVLDTVEFSLIVPYFKEAEEVRIYNEQDMLIGQALVNQEESFFIYYLLGAIVLILFWIGVFMYTHRKHR